MLRTHSLLPIAALLAAPAWAQEAVAPEITAASPVVVRDITFHDDLRVDDIALVGIHSYGAISFGIPDHWDLQGQPELHMSVVRSAQLIPEVSAITVWADGRPQGTIPLDGDVGGVDKVVIPLHLDEDVGYHQVTFLGYHRSRLPCEIDDHPGLWSRILDDSFVRVRYAEETPKLSLSQWPYPFRDDRDPNASRVVLVVSEKPTEEEAQAVGYIASTLGSVASWRPLDLYLHQGPPTTAPAGHLVVLARSDKPGAALGAVKDAMMRAGDAELVGAADGVAGGAGQAGLLALMPRPDDPTRAMLALVGRDGNGIVALARMLSQEATRNLASGLVEVVDSVQPMGPMAEREWKNTVPSEASFTLTDLGMQDRMATGYRGGRVVVPLKLVPDDHPVAGKARFHLKYSYSAQADVERSRLDVFLNGHAAGGVALRDVNGRNRQELTLELPVHEMGPESQIDVVFTLVGKDEHQCLGDNRVEMWGTVHADSSLDLPRDRWSYIPDLSLLRFGGFPMGLKADYSDVAFLLRAAPTRTELQLYTWLAAELGRVGRGDRFNYVVRMGSLERAREENKHIVLVDSGKDGDLIQKLGLLDQMSFAPKAAPGVSLALASGGLVTVGADPNVAYIEQVALPWNKDLTGVIAYARDAALFERVGRCLDGESLFDSFRGRVSRIASCEDVQAISATERHLLGAKPIRDQAYEPIRNNYWWLVAGVVVGFIVLLVLRAVWLAVGRRNETSEEEA